MNNSFFLPRSFIRRSVSSASSCSSVVLLYSSIGIYSVPYICSTRILGVFTVKQIYAIKIFNYSIAAHDDTKINAMEIKSNGIL